MRSVSFPYLEYRQSKAPIIPIALKGKNEWKQTTAYVDSGAAYSIFKVEEAERLGLNLKYGSYIPIYLHRLIVRIGDEELKATIAFSPNLGVGFNLLGRKDIFNHFDVIFSDSKEKITFTPTKHS